ncbi:uncharacterized protein LOC110233939 isoform X2 [Exaiptasia diaphana]|uniref:Uncharacterized protein n=1 Tax=Exaiptasia diaphana TaxID=2652724 RepID=A0A913YFX7_EXADI|nr:uncharacterized protein LOC110233939 isoform X2 [Exaiptasia diaphana]
MCFDEKNFDSKEGFVSRAIEKRVRNKRRRDPDMYVDVLLSSTVKRLKYELVNEQYQRKQLDEREISQIPKDRDIFSSNVSIQKELPEESEVKIAVECLQSTLSTLDAEIRSESLRSAANLQWRVLKIYLIIALDLENVGLLSSAFQCILEYKRLRSEFPIVILYLLSE